MISENWSKHCHKTSENYRGTILKDTLNQDELSKFLWLKTEVSALQNCMHLLYMIAWRMSPLETKFSLTLSDVLCLSFFSFFLHLKPDFISHLSSAHIRSHRPHNSWWSGVCVCLPVCFVSEGLSDRLNDRCWWVKVRLPQTIVHNVWGQNESERDHP